LRRRSTILAVLFVLAIVPYFVDLGGSSIWDANEAFYVETPREMMERADYITPYFNYEPRINKPVLSYWIVGAFYKAFGVSVGVERLAIALGVLAIIAAAAVLARITAWPLEPPALSERSESKGPPALSGRSESKVGRGAALLAAAGIASLPRLLMLGRRIFIDIWITAFMSLTLMFFALSERFPARRRLFLILMYVAAGLGMLTKGPVAIVLPGLAFLLYFLVQRELRRIGDMMLPLGALIVLLIVVPWYAALFHAHGWEYIRSFIVSENLERYTSGYGVHQDRSLLFYIPVILSDSFPLSPLLVVAAVAAWRERERLDVLLWCWIVTIVGFFSLSAGKQDLYIFPTIAAVVALTATAIERGRLRPEWRGWTTGALAVAAFLVALAGIGVLWLFVTAGRIYSLAGVLTVGVSGLLGGGASLILLRTKRLDAAVVALLAGMIAINWTFVLRVLPSFERYKPAPAISRILAPRLAPEDAVAYYEVALPSLVYYLRHHVDTYFEKQALIDALHTPRRVYVVLSERDYEALSPTFGTPTCVIERFETFDVKLRSVLRREPLPHLVLITNRCQ
jgi:4-amino-4-deoxy-L-arabinose transferase-like glycosyltransferase